MPRSFLTEVRGFTPVIDALANDLGLISAAVFGVAWRYSQMRDGVCTASVERISSHLGVNYRTTLRHLKRLCKNGYLQDTTPDLRNHPHTYAVTGKAQLIGMVQAVVQEDADPLTPHVTESQTTPTSTLTQSQPALTLSQSALTESQSGSDLESHEETTGETERNNNKTPVVVSRSTPQEKARQALVQEGVSKYAAKRLVRDHTSQRIAEVVQAAKNGRDIGNRAGWIVQALNQGYGIPPPSPNANGTSDYGRRVRVCAYHRNGHMGTCPGNDPDRKAYPWCHECDRLKLPSRTV